VARAGWADPVVLAGQVMAAAPERGPHRCQHGNLRRSVA